MKVIAYHRNAAELIGLLPYFLNSDDPRPAREQFDANYQSGWSPFKGFKLGPDNSLRYPGEPALKPVAETMLRGERIVFYESAWVAVIQPDRSFEVARMD